MIPARHVFHFLFKPQQNQYHVCTIIGLKLLMSWLVCVQLLESHLKMTCKRGLK